jgi:two-component system sensor histidine kinase/response regulator
MSEAIEVLIAEDSPTQALLLQNILERQGFCVEWASNGQLALQSLKFRPRTLVITDIQMPVMDGYELCHTIKSDTKLSKTPVMLLTSLSAPQDIIRGLECGADNFVVKPYDEEFLLSRVQTILANLQLRKALGSEDEIPIFFAGKRYVITSDRRQILNLLLSTYEAALQTNRDLTKAHEELKAAQAQLIEAEKLQSVGRLAAGVAHEVRNPLAILEMGITFLNEKSADEEEKLILNEMKEAVSRAGFVVSSLVDMASRRELGMRELEVHALVQQALEVFRKDLTQAEIAVVTEFSADGCAASVDAAKMEQALLNVFSNARDAMRGGGTLMLRTSSRTLEKNETAFDAGDRSGDRFRAGEIVAVIEVNDTGSGIAQENLPKIFDPFFSTKPTGKGMGLGLTVAKKIVDLHGGRIEVRNQQSGGTSVMITLKCVSSEAKAATH